MGVKWLRLGPTYLIDDLVETQRTSYTDQDRHCYAVKLANFEKT